MCRLQEKHTREGLRDHLLAVSSLQGDQQSLQASINALRRKIFETQERRERLVASGSRWAWHPQLEVFLLNPVASQVLVRLHTKLYITNRCTVVHVYVCAIHNYTCV